MKLCASQKAVLAAVITVLLSSAEARDLNQDEALRLRQQGQIKPLEQLLSQALGRHPGAVLLEAELEEDDGQLIYEIELLLPQGHVRELELNARTGQVLKDEVDD